MPDTAEALERRLTADLETLGDRLADEELARDLYRALTNQRWRRDGDEGHLSLSWSRAEALVNGLREPFGEPPLELAQTGGEGEISRLAGGLLEGLGWHAAPLDTGRHDDAHRAQPEAPPPPDAGARGAPVRDPGAWEREAHDEAEAVRTGRGGPPATSGEHAGGGSNPSDKA